MALALSAFTLLVVGLDLGCAHGGSHKQFGPRAAGPATGPSFAGRSYPLDLGNGARVNLPNAPLEEREVNRLGDGSRVTLRRYALTQHPSNFLVACSEVEGGIGGSLFGFLDGMLEAFLGASEGMELVSADAIWHQGYPGSAFELRNERGRRVMVRQFAGRTRAYTFAFAAPSEPATTFETTQRVFFESIQLPPGDAPSPAGDGRLDYTRFQWIYPPEGAFAAELPGTPSRTEGEFHLGDEDYTTYTYRTMSPDGSAGMRIRTLEIGENDRPDDFLARLQAQAAAEGGSVRGVRPAQRQGFGGQAFVVEGATSLTYVLQIVTAARVVEMAHTMPKTDEAGQADNRRRFFNSLRLL